MFPGEASGSVKTLTLTLPSRGRERCVACLSNSSCVLNPLNSLARRERVGVFELTETLQVMHNT